MKLIDKDALVAEIEKFLDKYISEHTFFYGATKDLNHLLSFIDTLEVKEVDLEKKIEEWLLHGNITDTRYDDYCDNDIIKTAKHFFELGLKASNVLTWEDMKQIRDIMVECSAIGLWSKPDEEYYQEVVKRFKAYKGE